MDKARLEEALRNADAAGDTQAATQIAQALRDMKQPASVLTGQVMRDVPRQLGLGSRAVLSGALDVADLLASPIRHGLEKITGKQIQPAADAVPNMIGLPKPQGANERTLVAAGRGAAAALTPVGIAGLVKPVNQMAQGLRGLLTSSPGLQAASGAGAGGAVQAVAEAGGGPIEQVAAGLIGGIATPLAGAKVTQGLQSAGQGVKSAFNAIKGNNTQNAFNQNIDVKINNLMQNSGLTLSDLPIAAQNQLREEVAQALKINPSLSPGAVRRLAEFKLVGATPTQGSLTLNPAIVTQQKNAAKRAANSSDLNAQRLASVENENNQLFIDRLNELGANNALGPYETGENIAGRFQGFIENKNQRINQLYNVARDAQGRSAVLDGKFFTESTGLELDRNLRTAHLPKEIKKTINMIAKGEIPLTVDVAEQLKTIIASEQRGTTNGNVRSALGIVREQLEKTPLKSNQEIGQEAIKSFNAARKETYAFKQMQKANPILKKFADGEVQPDKLFEEMVLRQPANVLERSIPVIGGDGLNVLRNETIQYLKGSRPDDLTRISGVGMQKLLSKIGDKKLEILFGTKDRAKITAIANVASYDQFQPVGSAVNNSNTAAAVAGIVERIAQNATLGKLPLGLIVQDPLKNIIAGQAARTALNPINGLIPQQSQSQTISRLPFSPLMPSILDDTE